ncbi:hypothetical protein SUGI_0649680 [Cryptomeria japonica]|nr:hypothetical protein SUGI_0649680 [Cryptomeria japonica]
MVHHFGLSVLDAVWRLVATILGGGRHWCDSFVYEAVICPIIDILGSKEVRIQRIDSFIRAMDGQAIANEILNLDADRWVSRLGSYFNSDNYVSSDLEDDQHLEDEERDHAKVEKERLKSLIEDVWEVYQIGVINKNFSPFQRLLDRDVRWLTRAIVGKVMEIGVHLAIILQAL